MPLDQWDGIRNLFVSRDLALEREIMDSEWGCGMFGKGKKRPDRDNLEIAADLKALLQGLMRNLSAHVPFCSSAPAIYDDQGGDQMATSPHINNREGIWMRVGLLFFALGILASLYYIYDLMYPNHFVGDMYGLEMIVRLSWLCGAAGPMFLGGVLLFLDWRKKLHRWRVLGTALVIVSSVILVVMTVDVVAIAAPGRNPQGLP